MPVVRYDEVRFKPKGLQHLFNCASMRRTLALWDQDEEASALAFAEMCVIYQFAESKNIKLLTTPPAPREWGDLMSSIRSKPSPSGKVDRAVSTPGAVYHLNLINAKTGNAFAVMHFPRLIQLWLALDMLASTEWDYAAYAPDDAHLCAGVPHMLREGD